MFTFVGRRREERWGQEEEQRIQEKRRVENYRLSYLVPTPFRALNIGPLFEVNRGEDIKCSHSDCPFPAKVNTAKGGLTRRIDN